MIENKYHSPIKENLQYIESLVKDGAKVLEIGPGFEPFSKARFLWLDYGRKRKTRKL